MKVLVANDKGGVGKSTIAQYFVVRIRQRLTAPRIVEWDFQPKLHRFFGRDAVESFGLQIPSATDEHLGELLEHFDPLVKWLKVTRPCVVDFGAQGWHQFTRWAEMTRLKDMVRSSDLWIVSPLTADIESLDGVTFVVETVRAILPNARIVVPMVLKDGDIDCFKGLLAYELLQRYEADGAIRFCRVPRLPSEGYAALASRGLTFDVIEASDPKELVARAPLSPMAAARALGGVLEWLRTMDAEFDFMFPGAASAVGSPQPKLGSGESAGPCVPNSTRPSASAPNIPRRSPVSAASVGFGVRRGDGSALPSLGSEPHSTSQPKTTCAIAARFLSAGRTSHHESE